MLGFRAPPQKLPDLPPLVVCESFLIAQNSGKLYLEQKFDAESDFEVRSILPPPKSIKNDKKLIPKTETISDFFSFFYLLRIKTHKIMERNVTIAKKSFVPLAVCIWYPILIFKVGLGPYFFLEMGKNFEPTRLYMVSIKETDF